MAVTMLEWLLYYNPEAVPTASGGRYEGWTADDLPTMCPGFYGVPCSDPDEPCPDILEDCDRCKECWGRDVTGGLLRADEAVRIGEYVRGLREGWDRGLAALKDIVIRDLTCPEAGGPTEQGLRILAGDIAAISALSDKDSRGGVRNDGEG